MSEYKKKYNNRYVIKRKYDDYTGEPYYIAVDDKFWWVECYGDTEEQSENRLIMVMESLIKAGHND